MGRGGGGGGGAGGRGSAKAGGASKGGGGSPSEQVMSGLESVVAKEGEGTLVAMRTLRESVPLSKEKFDAAVLDLYAKDKVILHHHDYVASLTPKERAALVTDKYGNNWHGIALPRR